MGKLEKVREIYDLKFAELKSPENWRNTLKDISKYYKFNFVEAILIHSQANNTTVMAEMKNWNKFGRYVKMGEHGIAVFTARTDTKLKYLFDIGQTQGKPIEKAWNIRESEQRERLIRRYNAKYGTDYTKASQVVKDVYSAAMDNIKGDIEKEIEVYKPQNIDTIKQFVADSALCIILSRCGFNIPEDKLDFSAVSEIIPDGLLAAVGNLSMKAAHEALMEIENAIRRKDYEQQIQNQGNRLGIRGEGRDIISEIGRTNQQSAAQHNGEESGGYAERNESHSLGYGEYERSERENMGGDSRESDRQGNGNNEGNEEKSAEGSEGESAEGNRDPNRSGTAGRRADEGIGETTPSGSNDTSSLIGYTGVAAAVKETVQNNTVEESSEDGDSFSFPNIPDNSAIVKIEWSESADLQDGEIFSFAEINRKLLALDNEQRINRESEDWQGSWYDKTRFTLYAKINGSEEIYEGRYDIGDGDGTLLHHMELCYGEEARELIAFLETLEQKESLHISEEQTEIIEKTIEGEQQSFVELMGAEEQSDKSENSLTTVKVGDFYEFRGNDAEIAAETLGLTLTSRNGEPMVGVPQHSLEQYIEQLNNAGFDVNFAESTEKSHIEKVHSENEAQNNVISNFREKTAKLFNPIDGYSAEKIEQLVKEDITNILYENKIMAEVGEVVLIGSRSRGTETDISDLDFVVEVKSDLKEYALFNILNEESFEIGGVTVDINPIKENESGSLSDYLTNAEQYMQEKEKAEQERIEKMREVAKEQDIPFSDRYSEGIAKLLYPNADIKIQGFEYSNFEDGTFDVAVGNVPFENYRVTDSAYEDEYVLHDYFFIKTLDKLKPGGIAAFITSSGTLDKFNNSARIDIANRAELIGAIKLPGGKNGAFKAIAGTEATTDIIFLQKREHTEAFASYNMPNWAGSPVSVYNKENHYSGTVNKYFAQNPEMILGEIKQVSGPYGSTTQCLPREGTDLYEELEKALSTLQCEFTAKPTVITEEGIEDIEENRVPAADSAENYCFYIDEKGTLYYRENEYMTPYEVKSPKNEKAIKAMCGLCGCVKKVIDVQLKGGSENELKSAQNTLEKEYDSFVKSYGYLNKAENIRLFRTDMRSSLLLSLEQETDETENTGVYEKADIFTKATISPAKTVEKADSPQEALAISLNLKNAVNIPYMARLCGETEEKVISDFNKYLGLGEWRNCEPSKAVGKFRGFDISFYYTSQSSAVQIKGVSGLVYGSDFTLSAVGTCIKIENLANGITGRKRSALLEIEKAEKEIETAKAQYGKPFEYAEELNGLLLKQADINSRLEFGEEQEEIIDGEWEGDEAET